MNRFIVLALMTIVGCAEPQQKKPDYLIDDDKMVELMVDMHLVETAQNLKLLGVDTTNRKYQQYFNAIFESHGVSKADYDSSLLFYSTETEQMNEIYDKVLETLYELETESKQDQ